MEQATPFGQSIVVEAPAKINWFLEILRRREDGFHEIQTVMQKIAWSDRLSFELRRDNEIHLSCDDPELATDESNLVVKAARALQAQTSVEFGVNIRLEKRVPYGAGLGGGSSDASTTLNALNRLVGLEFSNERLKTIAATIGSDTVFFLDGPLALCEGRGERITTLQGAKVIHLVVVWPGLPVSTKDIYESGTIDLTSERVKCNFKSGRWWEEGFPAHDSRKAIFNRLTAPCQTLFAFVASSLQKARECCNRRVVSLSGSGSSLFVVCESEEDAQDQASVLKGIFGPPAIVKATHTLV